MQFYWKDRALTNPRMKEHLPRWLLLNQPPPGCNSIRSSITKHILNCAIANIGNSKDYFSIIGHENGFKLTILEAILIKTKKPQLCVQKEHDYALKLPW